MVTSFRVLGGQFARDRRRIRTNLILHRATAERHEHVQAAAAGRLGERFEPVILELRAQQQGRARRRREAVRRIEVEGQPVGPIEVIGPAVHHVHRDAAVVDERQERLAAAADDVVDVAVRRRRRNGHRRHASGRLAGACF